MPDDALHCSPDVRLAMLARAPMFSGLSPERLAEVDDRCRAIPALAGATIHRVGDAADRFHVIATGLVKLLGYGADGRPVLHDIVAPGESFGSLQALGDPVHDHDAVVVRSGCLLAISTDEFRAMVRDIPGVAEAALEITVQRLREARGTVDVLSTLPVEGRIAASLVRLAGKIGEETPDGVHLSVGITQGDLAAMAATSAESVSRTLAQWRRLGLAASGRAGIVVHDLAGLERVASGNATQS